MEKDTIREVVNDIKAKRDALSLAHEQLKKDNDDWNKGIIVLSLMTGMFESIKIQMGWSNNIVALVPIALSSVIASISALIKFKKFPEQMEIIIQSTSLLTNTLNKCRNQEMLDHEILVEYHDALEKLETSVYPDIRKKYLKMSHKNLISIMEIEQTYFANIEKVNKGEKVIQLSDDDSSKVKSKFNPLSNITRNMSKQSDSSIATEQDIELGTKKVSEFENESKNEPTTTEPTESKTEPVLTFESRSESIDLSNA